MHYLIMGGFAVGLTVKYIPWISYPNGYTCFSSVHLNKVNSSYVILTVDMSENIKYMRTLNLFGC